MKLLCAADLHLGRQPSRLPSSLRSAAAASAPLAQLSAAASWRRLVAAAKELEVHAVLLAGDVLDDEHDYFEAFGDLRSGVAELVAAGIQVLAVSGNHDIEVLPRLARAVPELVLLGEGGSWEAHTLSNGQTTVHVLGWSYPTSSVTTSPLASLPIVLAGLAPATTVGLLHCDRDQSASRYAPVSSGELAAAGVDAWLLGHVHRPDIGFLGAPGVAGGAGPLSGYLGSTFAADPGEEGSRGAWLVEVGEAGLELTPVPLSPLRFETITIDVSDLADPADAPQLLVDSLAAFHQGLVARQAADPGAGSGAQGVEAVGCRLLLSGRHAQRSELASRLEADDPHDLLLTFDGVNYFVHDVRLDLLPAIDIAAAARGSDPLALAARKLLVLDGPESPELSELLAQGRERLQEVANGKYYRGLDPPDLDDQAVRGYLRRATLRLLDQMAPP